MQRWLTVKDDCVAGGFDTAHTVQHSLGNPSRILERAEVVEAIEPAAQAGHLSLQLLVLSSHYYSPNVVGGDRGIMTINLHRVGGRLSRLTSLVAPEAISPRAGA